MAENSSDSFVNYYQRELQHLRHAGSKFAVQHPKIAKRLELNGGETPDPHVERLIESFAYLTAGLQKEVDQKFPRITSALLSVLYPQFTCPVPSTTIAQFAVDPKKGKHTTGHKIERSTPVFARSQEGAICHFKTCYPVELWPIQVTNAEIVPCDQLALSSPIPSRRVLKITIKTLANSIQELGINKLRFYLHGSRALQNSLYELLFTETSQSYILNNENSDTPSPAIPAGSISPVGFEQNEEVIPNPTPAHPAYRYLFEYFNCPQKFLFFDVDGMDTSQCQQSFDLLLTIPDHLAVDNLMIEPSTFALGCTPIINLFEKTSEPIRLSHKVTEYKLTPDYRRERTTEIHSIKTVFVAEEATGNVQQVAPYFSFNHFEQTRNNNIFWHSRRTKTVIPGMAGTDIQLSFVDLDLTAQKPLGDTTYAKLWCTNRQLAHQMPQGATLESQTSIPAYGQCLEKPSAQVYPPQEGDTQWRLISQLGLNHLSVGDNNKSAQGLKETLQLYAGLTHKHVIEEIAAIHSLTTRPVTRRFMKETWRGFAQGTHIDLTFDASAFGGKGAYLFSTVLNEFFALFTAMNSFTELEIHSTDRKKSWKKWPVNHGERYLL